MATKAEQAAAEQAAAEQAAAEQDQAEEQLSLHICNLVAGGMSLPEAKKAAKG